jgi:hypothetical protein
MLSQLYATKPSIYTRRTVPDSRPPEAEEDRVDGDTERDDINVNCVAAAIESKNEILPELATLPARTRTIV